MRMNINEYVLKQFEDKARYLVSYGGAGSGKSYGIAQKIIKRCLEESGHHFLIIRKTIPAVEKSCYRLIKAMLSELDLPYKRNETKRIIQFNGNYLYFEGLDDPEKIKSIPFISSIWIEEATELDARDIIQLDLRLRGKTVGYKQIMFTFNPINDNGTSAKMSALYKMFFEKKNPNASIYHTTYKDNAFIDDEYKKVLENLRFEDEVYYRVYVLGEWVEMSDVIFNNFVIEEFDEKRVMRAAKNAFGGVDFGYNDPSVFLPILEYDGELYIFDEVYERKLLNIDFINRIKKLMKDYQINDYFNTFPIYADSSRPEHIKEFNDNFLYCRPAKKDVMAGINYCKSKKIHFHPRCVNAINDFKRYKFKRVNGVVKDEPAHLFSHAPDAFRYAVYSDVSQFKILETPTRGSWLR